MQNGNLATHGCPCGYFNSVLKECICTPLQIHRYLCKISGPLLDRIDLHVDVPEVKYRDLIRDPRGENSALVAKRVEAARKRQVNRFRENGVRCNAQMTPAQMRNCCRLDSETKKQFEVGIERLGFSARAYDRVLKVLRTTRGATGF